MSNYGAADGAADVPLLKSRDPGRMERMMRASLDKDDESEGNLIASLEKKDSMKPPLSKLSAPFTKSLGKNEGGKPSKSSLMPSLPKMAVPHLALRVGRKIRLEKAPSLRVLDLQNVDEPGNVPMKNHRRVATATDQLFDYAQHMEDFMKEEDETSVASSQFEASIASQPDSGGNGDVDNVAVEAFKATNDSDLEAPPPMVTTPLLAKEKKKTNRTRRRAKTKKMMKGFDCKHVAQHVWLFFVWRVLFFMVPLLGMAHLLYYYMGNPAIPFLPKTASVSWWLILIVRLQVTFNLSQLTQFLVEYLALKSQTFIRIVGPLVTLVAMQSTGWPFLIFFWALWTLMLTHGATAFHKNWFHFLNFAVINPVLNPDDGILESDIYMRILLSMVLVGSATAAKRILVNIQLATRLYLHFRPKMDSILIHMNLIAEVADLAMTTESIEFEEALEKEENLRRAAQNQKRETKFAETLTTTPKTKSSNKTEKKKSSLVGSDDESTSSDNSSSSSSSGEGNPDSDLSDDDDKQPVPYEKTGKSDTDDDSYKKVRWGNVHVDNDDEDETVGSSIENPTISTDERRFNFLRRQSSVVRGVISQLERWQEPEAKLDVKRNNNPSIHDILKFRKALAFLDDVQLFGCAFGDCHTRNKCVRSAMKVYKRLLRFTPEEDNVQFDVIGTLAYDRDGKVDDKKVKQIVSLFRPDKNDELTMLAFIQSCDTVYKKVRFFRASLQNSATIDIVLSNLLDWFFFFVLGLTVMNILGSDPWPLLVSLSTLVVSFAFAFGPSLAKYIEGILLIAMRRPYDIGDRITISGPEVVAKPMEGDTWLVEDITLTSTTLRYAGTNEVSSLNNFSISNSRIVNLGRSPRALIKLSIPFNIDATHEQINTFREKVEHWVRARPRTWHGLVHFRTNALDANAGYVEYTLVVQHIKSWQDIAPIMVQKGELLKQCNKISDSLGITYDSPPSRVDMVVKKKLDGEPTNLTSALEE